MYYYKLKVLDLGLFWTIKGKYKYKPFLYVLIFLSASIKWSSLHKIRVNLLKKIVEGGSSPTQTD
jgi:hypothetical protein